MSPIFWETGFSCLKFSPTSRRKWMGSWSVYIYFVFRTCFLYVYIHNVKYIFSCYVQVVIYKYLNLDEFVLCVHPRKSSWIPYMLKILPCTLSFYVLGHPVCNLEILDGFSVLWWMVATWQQYFHQLCCSVGKIRQISGRLHSIHSFW